MKGLTAALLAASALAIGASGCAGGPGQGAASPAGPAPAPTAPPPAAAAAVATPAAGEIVANGRRTYTMNCARCHGLNLVSNGIGFDLRRFPEHDKARFLRSVNQGLRNMPAWQGILSADQVESLWAYVGSVNAWGGQGP